MLGGEREIRNWVDGAPMPTDDVSPAAPHLRSLVLGPLPRTAAHEIDDYLARLPPRLAAWLARSDEDRRRALMRLGSALRAEAGRLADIYAIEYATSRAFADRRVGDELDALDDVVRGTLEPAIGRELHPGVGAIVTSATVTTGLLLPTIAALLLDGSIVILQPGPSAPVCITMVAELASARGVPPGVLNVVHGDDETTTALLSHPCLTGMLYEVPDERAEALGRLGRIGGKRMVRVDRPPIAESERLAPSLSGHNDPSVPPTGEHLG